MSVPHACMYGPGSFAMFMAGQLAESFIMSISGCAVLQSLLLDGSCSMACLKITQNIAWGYSRNSLVSCAATAAVCARAVCKSCWGKHKVVDSLANQARSTGGDAHKKWMVTMATLSRTNRGLSCPAFAPVTTTIAQPNPRPTTDPVRRIHTYV